MAIDPTTSYRDLETPKRPRWQRNRAATTMTATERARYDEGRAQGLAEAARAVEPLLASDPGEVDVAHAARLAHAALRRLTEGT